MSLDLIDWPPCIALLVQGTMIVVVEAGVCNHEQLPPHGAETVWTVTGRQH